MKNKGNNYAFIDGQNLNLNIRTLGWNLDYKKFRKYLEDKYSVKKAFYCIDFVGTNNNLYRTLQEAGFILILKPTVPDGEGSVKGNVDADLVLTLMQEFNNFEKAVVVSGDGDFYNLIDFLIREDKLENMLVPSRASFSTLYKRINTFDRKRYSFVSELRSKLEFFKRKRPHKD